MIRKDKRKRMANILPAVLGIACVVFLTAGLRIFLAPEAKVDCYKPARARIVYRGVEGNAQMPGVEFNADGKTVTSRFRSAVPRSLGSNIGDEMDILYCHSRVMFIDNYTVVPDDGESAQHTIRFYRMIGILMIVIGLLFIIPIALILKK
jgi:hypothetical protein